MRKGNRVVVFGIFDGVHDGHRDLFRQAKEYGNELVVIVGRDSASLRWKGRKPLYSEEARMRLVSQEERVDRAVLGDEEQSTYGVIDMVNPDVICLGYDQELFKKDLELWLEREKRAISCVVLRPYKESVFHTSLLPHRKGFTLIELLVVIAVIGLLASIVLVSLGPARARARDTKRIQTLNQMAKALQLYYDRYSKYPNSSLAGVGCWPNWESGSVLNPSNSEFLPELVSEGYFPSIPIETNPTSSTDAWQQCSYRYMRVTNPCGGCTGTWGVLYATCETSNTCPRNERPACCTSAWGEGDPGFWDSRDITLFLRE